MSIVRAERTQTPVIEFIPHQSFFPEPSREKKEAQILQEVQNKIDELKEIINLLSSSCFEKAGESYESHRLVTANYCEVDGRRFQECAKIPEFAAAFNCGKKNVSDKTINQIYNSLMFDFD
jgi:hypothetical protein